MFRSVSMASALRAGTGIRKRSLPLPALAHMRQGSCLTARPLCRLAPPPPHRRRRTATSRTAPIILLTLGLCLLAPLALGDVNQHGEVVGWFLDEAFVERGFRYADGVVTPLEVPGSLWTSAWGTNDAGQIVGQYHDGRRPRGFLFEDGQFTSIDVSETMETFPFDINNRGQVVGWSHLSVDDPTHRFLAIPRRLGDLVGRLR